MKQDRALIRRITKRVEHQRVESGQPLALHPLRQAQLVHFVAGEGGECRHNLLPCAFFLAPQADRSWTLHLAVFNSEIANKYALHYAYSRLKWSDELDATAHDLYAVVCTFDHASRAAGKLYEHYELLAATPGLWTGRSLDELLGLAAWVWADTDPPASESIAGELYEEGRRARRRSLSRYAEGCLTAAIDRARKAFDWELVVLAHLPLAFAAADRGSLSTAAGILRKARAIARRHGLREAEGAVLHEMVWHAANRGDPNAADRYAALASEAYGPGHPWRVRLAHDVGWNWIARGQFARGLPLVRATCAFAASPEEELCSWGSIARAAGGLGDEELLEFAYGRMLYLVSRSTTEHFRAEAWLNLARGLSSLCRWNEAEQCLREVVDLATKRREAKILFEAEAVLASILVHRRVDSRREETTGKWEALAHALLADVVRESSEIRFAESVASAAPSATTLPSRI